MKRDPNEPVTAEALASAGVSFLYDLDPLQFNYPAKEKPWTQFLDPKVAQIVNASTFLFSDILTVTQFYSKFWDEHFHGGSSIRYILNGTGFFDIRDSNDEWVRVKVSTGDFMQFPAGLSHRFSVDESKYIHVLSGPPIRDLNTIVLIIFTESSTRKNTFVVGMATIIKPRCPLPLQLLCPIVKKIMVKNLNIAVINTRANN